MTSEVSELRRANEILRAASVFFAGELDPHRTEVSAFIDEHRSGFGVKPICRILGVSASVYYDRATGRRSNEPQARGVELIAEGMGLDVCRSRRSTTSTAMC